MGKKSCAFFMGVDFEMGLEECIVFIQEGMY